MWLDVVVVLCDRSEVLLVGSRFGLSVQAVSYNKWRLVGGSEGGER